MFTTDHLPGRSLHIEGEEWLYFSGTAYLGIPHLPAFRERLNEGLSVYGTNFGGSRRSNLRLRIFEQAEQQLADWQGTEAALTVSSGSLAGQLLVKYLQTVGDCYYAPNLHPALIGQGQAFTGSWQAWQQRMLQVLPSGPERPIVLLCNAVDPLYARAFDFEWVQSLPDSRRYLLVVDDSHGIGVCGPHGQGSRSRISCPPHVELIVMASLGKAMGIPAGAIFGSQQLIDHLWDSPFFGGASPVVPAYLYALFHSFELLQQQVQLLRKRVHQFQQAVGQSSLFQRFDQYPVFYTQNTQLAEQLSQQQILISAFPYPGPTDPLISRVIINALHHQQDIERLVRALHESLHLNR